VSISTPPAYGGGPTVTVDRVYRFLLSRRWLGLAAAATAVAACCVLLGLWQLDRWEQRSQRNDLVATNLAAAPVAADRLLGVRRPPAASAEWRRVRATGRYDASAQLLVRNRPLDGSTGYHVLTPLVPADGPALLVNRGWVPAGREAAEPDAVPTPPSGEVTVVGRVRPAEDGDGGADAPAGQVRRIDVPAIAADLPYDVYAGYAELVRESPSARDAPTPLPEPDPGPGPNLAYALQWFVFAAMALGGLVVLARREAREDAGAEHGAPEPAVVAGRAAG
jgi:cytochrome oxidase assembly protein ShyY1